MTQVAWWEAAPWQAWQASPEQHAVCIRESGKARLHAYKFICVQARFPVFPNTNLKVCIRESGKARLHACLY